jgi:membrane-associated PAP2 superfamily phosphatase
MNKPDMSEMAVRKNRHFLFTADFIFPLLLLMAGSMVFRFTSWDLRIQDRYYSVESGWSFNSNPLAMFIYHYSNIPALILSIGALFAFMLSYSKERIQPYRKIAIYLVLVMVIGPGLLVNSILKDNWGRPRPRDLVQYGGEYRYETPLTYDAESPGKSFPCGHATMGYYFFALAFVLRQRKRALAALISLGATIWGSIIGWIRVGQGGHFVSDVLWAGILVYLTAFLLYRAIGLHKSLFCSVSATLTRKKLKPGYKILLGMVGLLIVLGVMLATPYSVKHKLSISSVYINEEVPNISLDLAVANLKIDLNGNMLLDYEVNGFGFPGSKLTSNDSIVDNTFIYKHIRKGFFTELSCKTALSVDTMLVKQIHAVVREGDVTILVNSDFVDTLFVSPYTKLVPEHPSGVSYVVSDIPQGRYWIKAPILRVLNTD